MNNNNISQQIPFEQFYNEQSPQTKKSQNNKNNMGHLKRTNQNLNNEQQRQLDRRQSLQFQQQDLIQVPQNSLFQSLDTQQTRLQQNVRVQQINQQQAQIKQHGELQQIDKQQTPVQQVGISQKTAQQNYKLQQKHRQQAPPQYIGDLQQIEKQIISVQQNSKFQQKNIQAPVEQCGELQQIKKQQTRVQQNGQIQQIQSPTQKEICTKCGLTFTLQNIAIIAVDQKYCDDCLEEVLQQQQRQIKFKEQRYIFYKQFQSSLDQTQKSQILFDDHDETKIINQKQIQMYTQELRIIEANIKSIKDQCQSLKNQVICMQIQEEKFWDQVNRFDKRAVKLQQKALSAKFDKNLARNQIQKISKTSIVHSFAQIQIDDNIGYVQGLAMGKRSEVTQINWEQLNAGLGHILMTLNFLAINYHYQFQLIESIKIKGTLSEVLLKSRKQFYPLGYTGRDQEKSFGEIMQAILTETLRLSELMQESQKLEYSQQMRLPFKIYQKQGKIGQYYIDPSKIQDRKKWPQWTKAIRYFLINFKHLLTIYSICDHFL